MTYQDAQQREMDARKRAADTNYIDTVARLEPDIAMVDASAFYASAAISLKRIADSLEDIAADIKHARLTNT